MNYRTFSNMSKDIFNNMYKIPTDIDLIVAIPRSGLFPAQIISNLFNKPMTVIDDFIENRIFNSGLTRNTNSIKNLNLIKKVLVVDDTIYSGSALKKAKEQLSKFNNINFIYMTIYSTPESANKVDIFCNICPDPQIFEWNIFNSWLIKLSCFDIDGILCKDPQQYEIDDGVKYNNFITNVKPLLQINFNISKIVTTRLQKYRNQTEEWLKKNNFKYNQLIMLDLPTQKEKIKLNMHGKFKGQIYKNSKEICFFESSLRQAREIKQISNKNVFCSEIMNFI